MPYVGVCELHVHSFLSPLFCQFVSVVPASNIPLTISISEKHSHNYTVAPTIFVLLALRSRQLV